MHLPCYGLTGVCGNVSQDRSEQERALMNHRKPTRWLLDKLVRWRVARERGRRRRREFERSLQARILAAQARDLVSALRAIGILRGNDVP